MTRRRSAAWILLAVMTVGVCVPAGRALLWAQEGALGVQGEQQEEEEGAVAAPSPAPGSAPPTPPPAVEYAGEPTGETPSGHSWANMNWFALYLVIAGPTVFFVFRGISR